MQNKGAIKFFAIALAVVCVFQLSFTLITKSVETDAREYAQRMADKNKSVLTTNKDSIFEVFERRYLDSIAGEPVFNIFLKNYTYRECKEKELNLGLDLRGGMNVMLEVSVADLIKSMSNFNKDENFNKALSLAAKNQAKSQKDFVTLFGEAYAEVSPNGKLSSIFNTLELKDKIKFESTNEQVIAVIKKEANDAIDRSFNILRTRIDKFGVTQPNIQKLDVSGRILIELPGVKDKIRVRKLLQGTANLEFWETYDNRADNLASLMMEVNKKIADINAINKDAKVETNLTPADSASVKADTTKKSDNSLLAKLDSAKPASATADTSKKNADMPLFDVLQPAIQQQQQGMVALEGPIVGTANIKDTAKINAYFAMPEVKSMLPKNLRLLWTVKAIDKGGNFLQLIAIRVSKSDGRPPLEGNVITDASGDFTQNSSRAEVSMTMNAEGAQIWKRLTGENIGKSIAIVLDNYVYSFPNVNSEISGGRSSISGNFDINEAKDLANILKAGKLPATAKIVQEAVVGPSLGQEAIEASLTSFLIAIIVILLFMAFYYGNSGWVANLALFVNIFFMMGILTSLGAVLTLPGIAGIILTIGLSVDANILIFERIREELHAGASVNLAIKDGFKHAMSSILDSNITLLLLGIILYAFGTGPIQGFATTLIIGVLTSLFCAILISRLVFDWMLSKNKKINFSIKMTDNLYKNININFVGKRKIYYLISTIIIVAGIVAYMQKGLNLGVDFKGGRTYVVRFDKDMRTDEVRTALGEEAVFAKEPEVKTYGKDNQLKITTAYLIDENETTTDAKVETKLTDGLTKLGTKFEILNSEKVGENISDDIKSSAVWSILFSCLLMFVYIFIRFRKWQYGLGAVVALFHDVLIVLAVYAIFNGVLPFSLEIDQHFIAAILTVMGYTMTESVVVFDRIREYLTNNNKKDVTGEEKIKTINYALNSTLSRTINTSLTIFFVLLVIFIFGGEVIRGFIFALLIGRVIGTYSSLCISTPIVIDLDRKTKEELKKA